MTLEVDTWCVVFGAMGVLIVGLFSLTAVLGALRHKPVQPIRLDDEISEQKWYQDEDGEATEESQEIHSCLGQRMAIAVFSAAGLASALASLVMSTRSRHSLLVPLWLQSGTWVSKFHTKKKFRDIC